MSALRNFFRSAKKDEANPIIDYFLSIEKNGTYSPFNMALNTFEKLQASTKSEQEFYEYILEDIIFSSLYATFYEQILITIGQNPEVALQLIDNFSEDNDQRERIIAEQTQNHLNFILSNGLCPGCSCCDNHGDVAELIPHWQKGDIDFFINLFMGMQTIQFAMEHLLYDVLPNNRSFYEHLKGDNILGLRKLIFSQSENELNN